MSSQPPFYPMDGPRSEEQNDKVVAALGYIFAPVVALVILFTDMKSRPFLKYHAYQSLVFGVAAIVGYAILTATIVGTCLTPALFAAQIYYAYQAYTRGLFTIPLITDLTRNIFKDFPGQPSSF